MNAEGHAHPVLEIVAIHAVIIGLLPVLSGFL